MRVADLDELRAKLEKHNRLTAASIEITLRCNERCIHCLRNMAHDDGLAYDEVCDVLDQLAGLGCLKVTLTGGEPFMRRDFMDIVTYAWSRRFAIVILTNGTLITPAIAAELKRLHVHELQFSIYAAGPAIHDAITRIPGSYQRTLRGIHLTREQGLNVRVAMPVMAPNVDQVPAVAMLCNEMGVTFIRGPLIFPKNNGDLEPLNLLATDEQLQRLAAQYSRQEATCAVSTEMPAADGPLCSAGRDRIGIGPDGAIYPCDALRLPIGNVHRDRLADVWSRSTTLLPLRATRREHPSACWGCSARGQCMWCPGLSLQLMGNINVPNPQDCRRTRLNYARLEADAPGWSAPSHLREVQPATASCGGVPAPVR